jgi:hypothetical protein
MCAEASYDNIASYRSPNKLLFSEISPIWSERLKQARYNVPPFSTIRLQWYRELKNSSTCVVGEAYGFSSNYVSKCKECNKLGWRFMFYFLIQSDSRIEKTKIKFADHWNKEHSNIKNRNEIKVNTNSQVELVL